VSGDIKTRISTLEAPYRREIWLDDMQFESGMRLLRCDDQGGPTLHATRSRRSNGRSVGPNHVELGTLRARGRLAMMPLPCISDAASAVDANGSPHPNPQAVGLPACRLRRVEIG